MMNYVKKSIAVLCIVSNIYGQLSAKTTFLNYHCASSQTYCIAEQLCNDSITTDSISNKEQNVYVIETPGQKNNPDWHRLWINTTILSGAFVGTLLVLECLPEDATSWNRCELQDVPLFKRWHNHVIKKVQNGITTNFILIIYFIHMPELYIICLHGAADSMLGNHYYIVH